MSEINLDDENGDLIVKLSEIDGVMSAMRSCNYPVIHKTTISDNYVHKFDTRTTDLK